MQKCLTLILLLIFCTSHAQIISNFTADDEGWAAAHTGGTTATFEYVSTGGNPGGYLSASPPTSGGSVNIGMNWYWVAPAKFLGQFSFSYGQHLKLDLKQSTAGTDNTVSDIILRASGGQSIHLRFPEKPGTEWTSYSIPLDLSADWRSNSAAGNVAYEHEIRRVLANLSQIQIRCKWINVAGYSSQLDNVTLEQLELMPAPTVASVTPTAALTHATVTINGTNFGESISNNRIYFGNTEATVISASATQLQVTVPPGATFAPIRVLNTSTGLSAQSSAFFQPQFNNPDETGGRIIASTFGLNVEVPYSAGVLASVMGDIDGDGWLDVVTLESGATMGIFRNAGSGGEINSSTFHPRVGIPSGEQGQGNSGGLALADFDNDGKLDLVTYSRGRFDGFANSGGITISRNISTPGNIAFEPARLFFEIDIFQNGITVADLDGDGRQDILINSTGLVIFQNTSRAPGMIEFAAARRINSVSGYVTVCDLNNDGKPEVIATGAGNTNIIFQNESTPGNIVITPAFSFPGSMVSGITAADLDGDGKQDLTFYRINGFNDYDLVIRKNIHTTGPVTEASLAPEIILSKINRAYSQRVADINGDNLPEIILMGVTASFVVFENVTTPGTLTQDSFIEEVSFQGNVNLNAPLVGDLNGDNKPDVITFGSSGANRLIIYENESVPKPTISVNTVSPLRAAAGSTITITGEKFSSIPERNTVWFGGVQANVLTASKTELTVEAPLGSTYAPVGVTRDRLTSYYHQPFSATFGNGVDFDNSHFAPPVTIALAGADYDIDVGDMNNDGLPDLLVEITNAARIFRNTYSGGAITADALTLDVSITGSFLNPKLQDFDGNGLLDVATVNGILRKNISTGSTIEIDANVTFGGGGSNLAFADFNQDGKMDMAYPSNGGAQLIVKENRTRKGPFTAGTFPSFTANINFAKPSTNGGIVTADFDRDGWPDIAVTNPTTASMSIYHNQQLPRIRTGSFTRTDIPTGTNPSRIYSGDFDNDGRQDLLLYHGTGANNTLLILLHNQSTPGNISFNRIDLTNPSATTVAHIADVDGDGRVDILTTSETGNRFSVFKNIHTSGALSAASFAAPFNTTVTAPRAIVTADLNVDGKPEIVITRNGFLAIYENLIPNVSITITTQPTSPAYACEGTNASFITAATGTTNITYQWQKFNTGTSLFENLTNNTIYSGVTTSTLSITTVSNLVAGDYRCLIRGDLAADVFTNVAQFVVNALPTSPDVINASRCGTGSVTLNASGGTPGDYRWYTETPFALITGEVNDTYATPVLTATTNYFVSLADAFCESTRVLITATISSVPAQPAITSSITPVANAVTVCSSSTLTLTAPAGFATYDWSNGESTQQITVAVSGIYFVTVTNAGGCASPASASLAVTILPEPCSNQPPVIITTLTGLYIEGLVRVDLTPLLSDPDDNLDLGSLRVLNTQTKAGASASINSFHELILDYGGILFTGVDRISIEVCDLLGACTQQQLTIYVEGDIIVRTGFSPNGDDRNDFFQIDYINLFPDTQQNRVTIYNRWGDAVFEITNYDNQTRVFRGLNKNGNELPSGTYFYKLEFTSGRKMKTGYLSLKR
ncbi:MAG: VCBS repeat-containing protein [Cyclobacteriaceae bacterium]|nr:VCBS repeat-containing protein [Cyclobacteriaceae bacterium]UYN86195.1 MAG: VCBS repeat-containing protein [Cyclobacteriaceae bacterium]